MGKKCVFIWNTLITELVSMYSVKLGRIWPSLRHLCTEMCDFGSSASLFGALLNRLPVNCELQKVCGGLQVCTFVLHKMMGVLF